MKRLDVAGTGSMVVDEIRFCERFGAAEEKVLLRPGEDGSMGQRLVGGVTLNHLGWAACLGARTGIFGKQADDANGKFLRAGMRKLGIEASIDLSGSASSFAQVYVARDGGRAIYMAQAATAELTADEIERIHRPMIEAARIVTTEVSQVPLAAARRALEIARAAGARTVLDIDVPLADAVPALGSEAELWALLECADILKPAASALHDLVEGDDDEARVRALVARTGCEAVALTRGGDGALIWTDGRALHAPAAKADVVDTTGAGDAFLGGLVAALALGLDWADAARLGNACGAVCCEQVGAFPNDPAAARERVLERWRSLGGGELALGGMASGKGGAATAELVEFLSRAPELLAGASARVDQDAISAATALIRQSEARGGRVHVTGVGKPEHLAHYAASLLSSTGTPATFLHATEATHGSLGQLVPGDVVIAISNSGATSELTSRIEPLREYGAKLIAVTARGDSPLAQASDVWLEARVDSEGGPLDLAPRASILAQTLVLAALSVDLQAAKQFSRADYNRRHPGGALGKKSAS